MTPAGEPSTAPPVRVLPEDDHNRELVANVHPSDWRNPTPDGRYNLVVIGAGTAGLVTAAGAAGLGAKVALIERGLMGGDCLNVGCVPSKALISAARAFAGVRDADRFGVDVPEGAYVDFGRVMERMRRLRSGISHVDSAARFRDLGVDVYLGQAKFTGSDRIVVGDTELRFKKACIATGARAGAPPIEGLAETGYLDNETVFSLTELPRRLAVIGAGPIGCELAQSFRRFGCEVFLFEKSETILAREDVDAARVVQAEMQHDGVRLVLGAALKKVESKGTTKVVTAEVDGKPRNFEVDEILVGVGRIPNVDGLGLEAAGVKYDPRLGVAVDDRLRTTARNIFAAGDVASKYKFTHAADFLARTVIQNALFFGRAKASALNIPWCTYTSPEVAHVGMYEHEAKAQGVEIDTYVQKFDEVDRAILDGAEEGFVKILTKRGKDEILGATIVAENAGDLISEVTLAMNAGAGLGKIASVIHPYPTQADAIRRLGDAYNRTRLKPGLKRFLERWFAWTR